MKYVSKILTLPLLLVLCAGLHAQEVYLNPLWELKVGDHDFLTSNHTQRGLAYNPATNHVLLVSRSPSTNVHILDADTGAVLGQLSMTGVSGGNFLLNQVAVAADGTIYAGNLVIDSGSSPYRLYRWENEAADPVLVYSGDPSQGDSDVDNRRFGDSLAVRGTGPGTEILLATWFGNIFSYLTPDGADNFTAEAIQTPLPGGDVRTLHFVGENLLYGSHMARPLHEMEFDPATKTVTVLRSFGGAIIASDIAPVAINLDTNFLAAVRTNAHTVALFNRAHLTTQWDIQPMVSRAFPTSNTNDNGTGAIAFAGSRIFALDTNNGVLAVEVSDQPPQTDPVEPGEIYWTNATTVRTAELDGSNPRTVLTGLTRAIGIAVDPVRHHVYYADAEAGVIGRANLDGSQHAPVLTNRGSPQFLKVHQDRLYWAEWESGLFSSALDGSEIEQLINLGAGSQSTAVVISTDGTVYLGTATGSLFRTTSDPLAPDLVASYATGTYGLVWHPATDLLYATSYDSAQIYSVDLGTGQSTWLNYDQQPLGLDLTLDGSQLVWADRSAGAIRMAGLTMSAPVTTILSGEDSPFGLVVVPELAELPAGFEGWVAQFDLPAGQSGPGDDPDGDGVKNLLEYALGGDPTIPGSAPLPATGFESDGENDYLALAVTKNTEAVGIGYLVEVSSDLVNWNSGEGHTVVVEETAASLIVRDATPLDNASRRFIRLRVEQE